MGFVKEFKEFATKGNVFDMAVGIVIGAAFGRIVTSLVNDVLLPPLGILVGGMDFSDLGVILKDAYVNEAGKQIPAVMLNYGNFIQTLIDFTIQAFAVFLVVKAINRLRRKNEAAPAAPPEPTKEEKLLTEIRDILKSK